MPVKPSRPVPSARRLEVLLDWQDAPSASEATGSLPLTVDPLLGSLVTLFLASLSGSLIGLGLIAGGRGGLQSRLPFGTFLAMAAMFAAAAGEPVVQWYMGFYR